MNSKIKLNVTILVIFIIISGLFFIGKSGFSILSGLRAYVGGEGLWAKSQKDATCQLIQYVFSGEVNRYLLFRESLKAPLGDKTARLELEKPDPSDEIIIQGFREGGNHPDDIPTMIFLYQYFKNTTHVREAIEQWEIGDRLIEELLAVGEQIKRKIDNNSMGKEQTTQALENIDALQKKLNKAENLFSNNMSTAARWAANLVFRVILLFTLIGSILCFILLRLIAGVISDLNNKKTRLEKNAEQEKLFKKELQESEEKFRNISENSLVGVNIIQDDVFIYVNPKFAEIFGYSVEECLNNMHFQQLVYPEDFGIVQEQIRRRTSEETKSVQYSFRGIKKSGEIIHVEIFGSSIVLNGKTSAIGTMLDITERKQMEIKLRQSQKLESIGTLAGGIAHDFNNILSSIIGFTELALDDVEKGTPLEDSLHEVYTAGNRAKELVKQILAFARQSDEEFKPIYPSTIAKEVLKLIRPSIPTSIEIRQNIESDSLIMGNATQVHQILMNLCTNAAYVMEAEGGVLDISMKDVMIDEIAETETPGNYIEISVSDTGVGIAPDILDKIFEPYFTTKDPGEGTGMGLAVVHGIVESYGGRITVDSKPDQGTRFTICLPVIRERQKHSQYETEALPTGKERILFVDDEAPIARMGSQILERLGYSVTTRTSSVEALELFRSKPNDFDLVITDMTMPNMTGDKFAAALIEIRKEIPVILCTGYSKQLSAERAAAVGIKAYAMKPLARNIFAKTVRKVLDEAKSSPQQ